jgi:hypothetical protein
VELTMKSSKKRDYVYISSPGKLANSWQMAFRAAVQPAKLRMTA